MSDDFITLEGREWTVSLSEKVSTGEYENFNPHVSLSGEIPAPKSKLNTETRTQVKRELSGIADDLQAVLDRSINTRLNAKEESNK